MKSTVAAVSVKKNETPSAIPASVSESFQLGELGVGEGGVIERLNGPEDLVRRLMELGLIEESYVEVVHEAPFGKDPIAVKVRGGLLALRRSEAGHVWVRRQAQR